MVMRNDEPCAPDKHRSEARRHYPTDPSPCPGSQAGPGWIWRTAGRNIIHIKLPVANYPVYILKPRRWGFANYQYPGTPSYLRTWTSSRRLFAWAGCNNNPESRKAALTSLK